MEQHGYKFKDMEDVAPMSVISNIRTGKRDLNKGQIDRLARKSPLMIWSCWLRGTSAGRSSATW